MGTFAVIGLMALQAQPVTALPLRDFMAACVQSGGNLGWFPVVSTGESTLQGVYLTTDGAAKQVTISFFNEDGSGFGKVRWFNSANTEVIQGTGIPESFTILSKRVRYGVSSTRTPTAVCTRVQ